MPFYVNSNTIGDNISGEGGDNTSTTGDQPNILIAHIGNVDITLYIKSNTPGTTQLS